jgi:microcompartment protein CcmK/EutM
LVEEADQRGVGKGEYLVALDMVGADRGQLVMTTQGSSCRWTSRTDDRPMDTLVVGIVDTIDEGGTVVYPAERSKAQG